jgi:hypothetical protein
VVPPLAAVSSVSLLPQAEELQKLSARGSAALLGSQTVYVSTSKAMHGLADLYPDLWAATVPICCPTAAPNKNFISEW